MMMQYVDLHGYHISKLTLGTVALGLDYGISNQAGKPGRDTSFEVLSTAIDAGINMLDTARSYGNAEELIGSFLMQNKKPVNVVTKFKFRPEALTNKRKLWDEVYRSVRTSLDQLHLEKVPFCLFHADRHLPLNKVTEFLPDIIEDLRKDGLIDIGGISIDHPAEADLVLQYPAIEAVQIPLNVFDLRLVRNRMIERMKSRGKIVFARSVFLQGLFFMSPADLKGNLIKAGKYIERLHHLAEQADMSIAQLAFSFVRDMEGITSIVFGAVNAAQVTQNVQLLQGRSLGGELTALISSSFKDIPEDIITPGLWTI
jgi:aryl-alcohol dehydrogenase-like predicted oxidoreductase